MTTLEGFVVGTFVVWRVTHLLHAEDGPWRFFTRLRARAGSAFWGGLLGCFYCLSLWTAVPVALWIGNTWDERVALWLAMSGAAILAERASSRDTPPLPAFHEDDEGRTPARDHVSDDVEGRR